MTAYAPCRDCLDEQTCGIRAVMKRVRDATSRILDETTLADLVEEEKQLVSARSVLDFHI